MLEKTQMEENHAFQYTSAIKRNGLPIPTIASLPNMPSKSSDNSSTTKEIVTPSTPVESLRRSTRITKGIPLKWLVINGFNDIIQLLHIISVWNSIIELFKQISYYLIMIIQVTLEI